MPLLQGVGPGHSVACHFPLTDTAAADIAKPDPLIEDVAWSGYVRCRSLSGGHGGGDESHYRAGWKPAVLDNLIRSRQIAQAVLNFPLPDTVEPASVFKP